MPREITETRRKQTRIASREFRKRRREFLDRMNAAVITLSGALHSATDPEVRLAAEAVVTTWESRHAVR